MFLKLLEIKYENNPLIYAWFILYLAKLSQSQVKENLTGMMRK